MQQEYGFHLTTWLIGSLVGTGQLLLGDGALTWRKAIGRALVSGGLGASAGAVLVWVPEVNQFAVMGLAAAIASLGTSGVEKLIEKIRR